MKLSAPVYRLKHKAKSLSRQAGIPLHDALDRIAIKEGFSSWSLLAAKLAAASPAAKLLAQLLPGDLMLMGSRPGQGKTVIGLELLLEAIKAGNRGAFFTLEYSDREARNLLHRIAEGAQASEQIEVDSSEFISAEYIQSKLAAAPKGTVVVVDYLQLLDQQRAKPSLMEQIRSLKAFACQRALSVVFLSQVDRSFDPAKKSCPDAADVRLPNPLNLALFNRMCFLHNGELRFQVSS